MSSVPETAFEFDYSVSLGVLFAIVAAFAFIRTISPFCENTFTSPGKVIITFYFLIFLSALLRAIWFFIPITSLQGSYPPPLISAFSSDTFWTGYSICLLIDSFGSICVFSVFMLISSYWQDTLRKVDIEEEESRRHLMLATPEYERRGPMSSFLMKLLVFASMVCLNLALFLCGFYNSEFVLLYISILFCIIPSALSIELTVFSTRMRQVLMIKENVNANTSTQVQSRRILAIAVAANFFFSVQLVTQGTLCVFILYLWRAGTDISFFQTNALYWDLYVCSRYGSEFLVLTAEIIVSTVVRPSPPARMGASYKSFDVAPYTTGNSSENFNDRELMENGGFERKSEIDNDINYYIVDRESNPVSPRTLPSQSASSYL